MSFVGVEPVSPRPLELREALPQLTLPPPPLFSTHTSSQSLIQASEFMHLATTIVGQPFLSYRKQN